MRRLPFFFSYVIGALLVIDAIFFGGQYRTAAWRNTDSVWRVTGSVWRDATYHGRAFSLDVERWIRDSLW